MKSVFSIFLVLLIFAYNIRVWLIVISFEMNRDYILENVCIGRSEPINMCGGSCYLGTQLELGDQQDDNKVPETTLRISGISCFLVEKFKPQDILFYWLGSKYAHFNINPEKRLKFNSIFHPPKI
jgi:hypothetical protein